MRVVQISDLHLGHEDPTDPDHAAPNRLAWAHLERLVTGGFDALPAGEPWRVVVTGDLADLGFRDPTEYPRIAAFFRGLPTRSAAVASVHLVPGNHDAGNFPSSLTDWPVNADRLAAWAEAFGPDRFSFAADGLRLLGCNSQVWGSGLAAEAEQEAWLREELDQAERAGEKVALFQHAPLFLREPDERRTGRELYWCPEPAARDRVLALLDRPCVAAVCNGHVHRWRERRVGPTLFRWCPAVSGTHTDADYFPGDGEPHLHVLPTIETTPGGGLRFGHASSPLVTTVRYA
ncbi:metallophosphoesterase family protein [Phycisphaera mikurensis]|uniref:Putative hydrolase n=1 Tax=Phycisphaera mikurensis (strain NBRC 102666 / KCTC 22515 / FYK2301M01) TaxID=1142394 RepID=I0IBB7_PHYMF|nr:metallophosphoesterase [Phycisphaera mikurensis]MBB6443049.1 3',5'-cyclic AMP phosphodiesterase CpdA [Phycisphaera mikurensis]BAM02555.1 putative hydrolase [Phycisphaera mikurensis NBRC 102666]